LYAAAIPAATLDHDAALVFDKTGTLTEGKPRLVSVRFFVWGAADRLIEASTEGDPGDGGLPGSDERRPPRRQ